MLLLTWKCYFPFLNKITALNYFRTALTEMTETKVINREVLCRHQWSNRSKVTTREIRITRIEHYANSFHICYQIINTLLPVFFLKLSWYTQYSLHINDLLCLSLSTHYQLQIFLLWYYRHLWISCNRCSFMAAFVSQFRWYP